MFVKIEVKDKAEGDALRTAMLDPMTRALTLINGHLLDLPTDRARKRVLAYVADMLSDPDYPRHPPSTAVAVTLGSTGQRMVEAGQLRLHDADSDNGRTTGE